MTSLSPKRLSFGAKATKEEPLTLTLLQKPSRKLDTQMFNLLSGSCAISPCQVFSGHREMDCIYSGRQDPGVPELDFYSLVTGSLYVLIPPQRTSVSL